MTVEECVLLSERVSGDWSKTDHRSEDSDIDDDVYDDEDDEVGYMVIDDDADIDESCDTDAADACCPAVQQVSAATWGDKCKLKLGWEEIVWIKLSMTGNKWMGRIG